MVVNLLVQGEARHFRLLQRLAAVSSVFADVPLSLYFVEAGPAPRLFVGEAKRTRSYARDVGMTALRRSG